MRQVLTPMPTPQQIEEGLSKAGFRPSVPIVNALLMGFKHMAGSIVNALEELLGVNLDRDEEFFYLDAAVAPTRVVAAAADTLATYTVGTEGDFIAVAMLAQAATVATPPVIVPNSIRVSLRDGGTGREFMRNTQPLTFLGQGVATYPAAAAALFLPKPRFFARTTQVFARFTSVDAVDLDVDLAFFGYRIFDANQLDLTRAR